MAKFGPYEIQTKDLDRQLDRIVKSRRNPGAYLERLDKAAKKEGATNAQRRNLMKMIQNRFDTVVKKADKGFVNYGKDAEEGKLPKYAKVKDPKVVGAYRKRFKATAASLMDDMMNPEPSQEGKPYGGSKELKETTRRTIKGGGELQDYKRRGGQKKAGGGKVYAMNRRTGGSIRKPRMK